MQAFIVAPPLSADYPKHIQTKTYLPVKVEETKTRLYRTRFKIVKSNRNIDKLEDVIYKYINDNKFLKSSDEKIQIDPKNKMQASLLSLKTIDAILPD